MSDHITVPERNISTITAEIIVLTKQAQASALASACQIGKRLVEAKAIVGHGRWGDYLKNEIAYSQSSANNFMLLYRELGETPNSQALANLSPTQALRLLALPAGDREEFVQENDVAQMSTRELEQAIKEKKAAQELLAAAQESANGLRQQVDDLQKQNAALESSLAKAKTPKAISPAEADKLRAEGRAQAQADCNARLDAAQEKAAAAEEARMDMEKALVDAQRQLSEVKRSAAMNDSNAGAFTVLFDSVQGDFNKLHGYLLKIRNTDPELGAKLKTAMLTLLKRMAERLEKGG